jgi:hypothetical protein
MSNETSTERSTGPVIHTDKRPLLLLRLQLVMVILYSIIISVTLILNVVNGNAVSETFQRHDKQYKPVFISGCAGFTNIEPSRAAHRVLNDSNYSIHRAIIRFSKYERIQPNCSTVSMAHLPVFFSFHLHRLRIHCTV